MENTSNSQRSSPAHRLIAALIWRQRVPDESVRSFIRPDIDLEHPYQRVLWSALTRIATTAESLNCTTLAAALCAEGALAAIGGPRALTALSLDGQRVSDDLIALLYGVRDASVRRRLLEIGNRLYASATEESGPLDDDLDAARAAIDALAPLAARRF